MTRYEILVARTEFLVALATEKAQFRTLYTRVYDTNESTLKVVKNSFVLNTLIYY